jgi:D-glycero-alpha-D-manno-heptose 1-phosphate guanylyltransferase
MHETIETYLNTAYPELEYVSVIESEPLGTGGGIQLACSKATTEHVLILNGDTFFGVSLTEIYQEHLSTGSDCTLALKPMEHFDRYGVVETNSTMQILNFQEKKATEKGNINGGVYLLKRSSLESLNLPSRFSFEKDFMEAHIHDLKLMGIIQEGYFIDIGIPEDYLKAQTELPARL